MDPKKVILPRQKIEEAKQELHWIWSRKRKVLNPVWNLEEVPVRNKTQLHFPFGNNSNNFLCNSALFCSSANSISAVIIYSTAAVADYRIPP